MTKKELLRKKLDTGKRVYFDERTYWREQNTYYMKTEDSRPQKVPHIDEIYEYAIKHWNEIIW